jgi:hypothetical protein
MKTELKTAKELFLQYRNQYNELVNIYCQAKQRNPFATYRELARAIWRVGRCLETWHGVALANEKQKYYQGG